MNTEKIVGYTLLAIGLIVLGFSALNMIDLLIGKIRPIEFFNFEPVNVDLEAIIRGSLPLDSLPPEVAAVVAGKPTQPTELLSADLLNQPANFVIHLSIMGLLAGIGQKIAGLGIMLLRPIHVRLKESSEKPT